MMTTRHIHWSNIMLGPWKSDKIFLHCTINFSPKLDTLTNIVPLNYIDLFLSISDTHLFEMYSDMYFIIHWQYNINCIYCLLFIHIFFFHINVSYPQKPIHKFYIFSMCFAHSLVIIFDIGHMTACTTMKFLTV